MVYTVILNIFDFYQFQDSPIFMPAHPHQLSGIFGLLLKWRKLVLLLLGVVLIVSTGIALWLPDEFKSTTIFYPTDINTVNPEQALQPNREDATLFGTTEDVDRLVTIALSEPVVSHISDKFNLIAHYGLDPKKELNRQRALDEFLSNYEVKPTERDAVEISFYDKDRKFAAEVTNAVAKQVDAINKNLILNNRFNAVELFNKRQTYFQNQLKIMQDSLANGRKQYKIYDLVLDTLHLNPGKTNLSVTGLDYIAGLEAQVSALQTEYIKAMKAFANARFALDSDFSTIYIVQAAYPAIKKARPIRWLIVAASVVLAFILAVSAVALLEMNQNPE